MRRIGGERGGPSRVRCLPWRAHSPACTSRARAIFVRVHPVRLSVPADRVARTRAAAARTVDVDVVAVRREQQARLPASSARAQAVDRLAGGAAVVATGQQVGLFLGPFTGLRGGSAVAVARASRGRRACRASAVLVARPGRRFRRDRGGATIPTDGRQAGAGTRAERPSARSVAHRRLGPGIGRLARRRSGGARRGLAADERCHSCARMTSRAAAFGAAFAGNSRPCSPTRACCPGLERRALRGAAVPLYVRRN